MADPLPSFLDAFARIDDPRKPRGGRHPFTVILALAFLELLCREIDFACLQRWAADHWRVLKPAPGFTHKRPPHATTISRTPARFSLEQFRDAFAQWLVRLPRTAVAADGKTIKQGHDAHGDPIHMLNVFAHELGLCLGQFPVTGGTPTKPRALKAALKELLEHDPFPRLFTADALFTQRPLAGVILEADRDFLFVVKDNRPNLPEAVEASFRDATERPPDAETREKKGARFTSASSGSSKVWKSTRP